MEHSTISNSLKNLDFKESKDRVTILDLPNEILAVIFSKLSQDDILKNVALVSKRFLEVSRLRETIPYIVFPRKNYWNDIYFNRIVKGIRQCIKFYPQSFLYVNLFWGIKYSNFYKLRRVAPYIDALVGAMNFDCIKVPPKFKHLEYLGLDVEEISSCEGVTSHFERIPGFWKRFPRLTNLNIRMDYMNPMKMVSSCLSLTYHVISHILTHP